MLLHLRYKDAVINRSWYHSSCGCHDSRNVRKYVNSFWYYLRRGYGK